MNVQHLTEEHMMLTCPECGARFRFFAMSDQAVSCPHCQIAIAKFSMDSFQSESDWFRYWHERERRREIMARITPYCTALPIGFPVHVAADGIHLWLAYAVWGAAHPVYRMRLVGRAPSFYVYAYRPPAHPR